MTESYGASRRCNSCSVLLRNGVEIDPKDRSQALYDRSASNPSIRQTRWCSILDRKTHLGRLRKVQRIASLCITGALCTSPTDALDIIIYLSPLHLVGKDMATNSAIGLKCTQQRSKGLITHSQFWFKIIATER